MEEAEKLNQPLIDKNKYNKYLLDYINKIKDNKDIMSLIYKTENPVYLHWEEIKNKDWIPNNYTKEEFWTLIRVHRDINYKPTPIKSQDGSYFKYYELYNYNDLIFNFELTEDIKNKYLKSSIMEESISSSQLEGANTTRRIAKKIILEEQQPSNNSERMILNNYNVMKEIQNHYKNKDLSINMIKELHLLLTKNDSNIEDDKKGVFRTNEDNIVVGSNKLNKYSYKTPDIEFVNEEINNLINFANNTDKEKYIHPIIKAIMLHFWFAYLHPFVDGNGRLSRCLFYWYLIKNNLEIFAYYPLSTVIKKSKGQYSKAYIYTEQDNNDLNYFIDYNIRKIIEAKKLFEEYVNKKNKEEIEINNLTLNKNLNHRQEQVLKDINVNKYSYITLTSYINMFKISKPTAISDLKDLEKKQLLNSKKVGREVRYYIV